MQNIAVQLELGSPIIIGRRMCGDGLVAGVLFEDTHNWEIALTEMRSMIEHTEDGVPKASQVLIEGPVMEEKQTFGTHFWSGAQYDPDYFNFLKKKKISIKTLEDKYKYARLWNTYKVINPRYIWFLFRGKREALTNFFNKLVEEKIKIGARRHSGNFGIVIKFQIIESTSQDVNFGIIVKNQLLRPYPLSLGLPDNISKASGAIETWHCPYHGEEKTAVYVPLRNPYIVKGREMRGLLR